MGDKVGRLLKEILNVAIETKALKRHALKHVNVDTTVHEKAIAFPTDARLYHKMRITLVHEAHKRYEFRGKASFITTSKDNWVVSAQSVDNPYDGHTLESALNYVTHTPARHPRTRIAIWVIEAMA